MEYPTIRTQMTSSYLETLPTELVIAILLRLNLSDLMTCQRSCKRLHTLIQDSMEIRLKIELAVEGMQDVSEVLSIDEKLRRLENYRRFWRFEELKKPQEFGLGTSSYCWALTSTVIASCSRSSEVTFCQIPSDVLGIAQRTWKLQLPFQVECIDMDQTQRLLVVVERRDANDHDNPSWVVHFLDSSTGAPHPRAKRASVPLHCENEEEPTRCSTDISSKLVGIAMMGLRFWALQWNTGEILMVKDSLDPHDQHGFAFLDDRYVIWPVVCEATEDDWEAYRIALFDCLDPPLGLSGSVDQLAELRGKYYTIAFDLPHPEGGNSELEGGTHAIALCMRDGHLFPATQDQPFVRTTDNDVLAVSFMTLSSNWPEIKQHTLVTPKAKLRALAESPRYPPVYCERGMRHQTHLTWGQWGHDARVFTTPINRLDAAEICRSRLHMTEVKPAIPGVEDRPARCRRAIYDFNPRPLRRDPRDIHMNPESCCEGFAWSDEAWGYRPDEVGGLPQSLPFRRTLLPPAISDSLPEHFNARGPPVILGDYFIAIQCCDRNELTYRVWSV